jgi:ribonuclease BN (tRNA processing enzyme)
VTAALANHNSVPNYAFRFDTPDRSFVFSGDTARSERLIALARGADVLVHEALYLPAVPRMKDGNAPALREHLLKGHTATEDVGRIAAAAGVKTVVLAHLVPAFPDITDAMWADGVRKHFDGEIIIGRDLMEI